MPKIPRPERPLGHVNVFDPQPDGSREVEVGFMPDPLSLVGDKGGKSKTVLAIDASASMRRAFGLTGPWGDPNYVEMVARKLGSILTEITSSGMSLAIYWAVSPGGRKIEVIGEYNEADWAKASIRGPKVEKWGSGTKLLPAIQLVVEKATQDPGFTMGVILTDGFIEDEDECKDYCLELGRQYAGIKPEPIKLVLIGIGEDVDSEQLERFDNLFEGTGIDYDLFAAEEVSSIEDDEDITAALYSELMHEGIIVAPMGSVEDNQGRVLASWPDGLPGKFRFTLPKEVTKFIVKTPRQVIEQDVTEAL